MSRCLVGALLALPAAGCASFTYVDADKVQHVIGFVDVATPAPTGGGSPATAVTVTTLGVAILRQPNSTNSFSLGYSKETLVSLPDGACIDLTTSGPCAANARSDAR